MVVCCIQQRERERERERNSLCLYARESECERERMYVRECVRVRGRERLTINFLITSDIKKPRLFKMAAVAISQWLVGSSSLRS